MRVAVASCVAYSDCWSPFLKLFRKFWPDCPYEVLFITDKDNPGQSWCSVVAEFAAYQKQPILLTQEDLLLSAPVQSHLIEHALHQMKTQNAAMVRLYPCPGSNEDYGDSHFGRISKGTMYRVSCMASIWNPVILHEIASHFNTPAEFELEGSKLSDQFDEPFLAFKREVHPWPLENYCSAISRGKWEPDAVKFCEQNGISVDLSMREMAV